MPGRNAIAFVSRLTITTAITYRKKEFFSSHIDPLCGHYLDRPLTRGIGLRYFGSPDHGLVLYIEIDLCTLEILPDR